MDIIFISKNNNKFKETERLFNREVREYNRDDLKLVQMEGDSINEIQTTDIDELINDKLIKSYNIYKRPVLIEHTILEIECLNNYPGTQTAGFWNTISKNDENKGDFLCNIVNCLESTGKGRGAKAKTFYAYCDGKNIIKSVGEVCGKISKEPQGESEFQWDTIFIPNILDEESCLNEKTFAELEVIKAENGLTVKDTYSMRSIAIKNFFEEFNKSYCELEYDIGITSDVIKEIAEKIIENKLILFIGAGVSASVNMPSWNRLIEELGNDIGYNKEVFKNLGDNLELAEFYSLSNKSEYLDKIVKYFRSGKERVKIEGEIRASKVYKTIVNLGIKTIYTTNYENVIESAFNIHNSAMKYSVIYDLKTLNNSNLNGTEIIKLHGDLNNQKDMVLTETSYYKRYDFENSLDIKLRNDLLTKSVLFIGYSFRDSNIKYMMHKLNSMWEKEDVENRPKSYIFLTENNPVQRKIIEHNNNMTTVVSTTLNRSKALEEFLQEIKESLDSKL